MQPGKKLLEHQNWKFLDHTNEGGSLAHALHNVRQLKRNQTEKGCSNSYLLKSATMEAATANCKSLSDRFVDQKCCNSFPVPLMPEGIYFMVKEHSSSRSPKQFVQVLQSQSSSIFISTKWSVSRLSKEHGRQWLRVNCVSPDKPANFTKPKKVKEPRKEKFSIPIHA